MTDPLIVQLFQALALNFFATPTRLAFVQGRIDSGRMRLRAQNFSTYMTQGIETAWLLGNHCKSVAAEGEPSGRLSRVLTSFLEVSVSDIQSSGSVVHIVDDEASIRRSMDFLLRAAGYRVEHWSDGQDFLRNADKNVPACVLMDVRMPGIDGLEVQRTMAAEGFDFPVVVMTGHGEIDLAVCAMKAGAVDFLVKPCDRQKLLDAVAQAFGLLNDCEVKRDRQQWARGQVAKLTERVSTAEQKSAMGRRKTRPSSYTPGGVA
ncbi:response regulator transcription factor [Novosphingobium sp. BL-8H]|uniref:response regulator transcription factor n=1 Tax=Novosphingobium sp. BL-8H TaxID=3127640 RepID=UPI003756D67E